MENRKSFSCVCQKEFTLPFSKKKKRTKDSIEKTLHQPYIKTIPAE